MKIGILLLFLFSGILMNDAMAQNVEKLALQSLNF